MLEQELLLAYHDRSDGGLIVTLCEMAFAGRSGLLCDTTALGDDVLAALFAEELGVVMQVLESNLPRVESMLLEAGLDHLCHRIGEPQGESKLCVLHAGEAVIDEPIVRLQRAWAERTLQMQSLHYNPACAP